jgi:uracil-DNA glycosylase
VKKKDLEKLKAKLKKLTTSPLYKYRKENNYQPVLGEGNLDACIMLVGEAPGRNEAEQSRPFCGQAGKRLDRILQKASLKRQDVYITNVVNDRPPKNRKPTKKEVELYFPFLIKQIQIIKPKAIVTLGATAINFFLDYFNLTKDMAMNRLRGRVFTTKFDFGKVNIIPTYHPSYLIYRPEKEQFLKQDLKKAKNLVKT